MEQFMRRSERSSAARLGGGEGGLQTPGLFQFRLVDRLQCQQSGTVKYTPQAADNLLSLQVLNNVSNPSWCHVAIGLFVVHYLILFIYLFIFSCL